MDEITIPKSEYDELRTRPSRDELAAAEQRAADAEKAVEKAEAEQAKAETAKSELETKVQSFEEQARAASLKDERMGALGAGFTAKLGEKTKTRLTEQASKLTDEEWAERLEELEEVYDTTRDAGAEAGSTTETAARKDVFTREEVARSNVGGGGNNGGDGAEPSATKRRSVVAGLVGKKS